jgi:hypothetical protein
MHPTTVSPIAQAAAYGHAAHCTTGPALLGLAGHLVPDHAANVAPETIAQAVLLPGLEDSAQMIALIFLSTAAAAQIDTTCLVPRAGKR